MSFFTAMNTSSTGLAVQRLRMDIISQNITGSEITKTEDGTPYKKKTLIVAEKNPSAEFSEVLRRQMGGENVPNINKIGEGVKAIKVVEDEAPFAKIYDPGHPEADEEGYVTKSNVNIVEEMVNMISASRSYEANVTAMDASKSMAQKALEIGR